MKRYKEEPGKRLTLGSIGLGGVAYTVHFDHSDKMIRAANHLMKCHPHHFAVVPNHRYGLVVSEMGAQCLKKAVKEGKIVL